MLFFFFFVNRYWETIAKESQDIYYISFYILKYNKNTYKLRNYLDYLVPSDFMVVLNGNNNKKILLK